MGFLDKLNPKKKVEELLASKVMGPAVERAVTAINQKGEETAKKEITIWVSNQIKAQAATVIPEPLTGASDEIINNASKKVVNEAFIKAKEQLKK
ncbi:MAG: hypothetical protein A2289_09920 [Deltaproteobacteria bacterium RIFOXYA12_FULL_58_15]|nr:MAG: hypothetical protein A2289_09920 [Deltaproteobacteria bacterium RIFOXYA12_FULL_58_15]OGR07331.1 MAG: hypothetical protein A2341_03155 [Deltaproteobacteria bacterium RIFOXYB12_FULL_58_9]